MTMGTEEELAPQQIEPQAMLELLVEMFGPILDSEDLEEAIELVLNAMIMVENTLLATDVDFLAGTQLDQPGVPGVYTIWIASGDATDLYTISLGGRTLVSGANPILRANAEIRENEDAFTQILSPTGGRPVISFTSAAGATARIRVKFLPAIAN